MVMQEALRFQTPAQISHYYHPRHDLTLGKYHFKQGDMLEIVFDALHHDPEQWQRPNEFLPERFDHTDPLSLTPGGKKRHPNSFIPFHGGSRVCFGKTLAEGEIKILIAMFTQKFDFSFEDARYETEIPLAMIDMSSNPPIWLKLREANTTKN